MIKQDAAKYIDFCHHIEGYGGFSPWLDEYDPLTETGFAFVHGGSEDNGQFGLGDIDLNFGTTEFSYKDILEKVKKYRDECKGSMDPDFPEECEYVEELDELVRALTDWCSENESKKSEGVEALKDKVVSDVTLKPEDLIPKFLNALKHDETAHSKFLKDYPEILEIQSWDDVDDETKSMLVDELTDALNGIAPDGYFFGASDGDGACFGFWKVDPDESKKSEALTKDTVVVGTLDNSNKKWIERTLQQIKKKFPNVESDAFGCTITVRGKLADVAKVLNAYPKGIPSWCSDKGGDFLPNAAGDNLDDSEVSKVLSESKKSEDYKNFTLKQLRFQLKNGWAKDLTNASDEEIQAIIDSGHEISGVSNGTYGMNGLKVTYSNPDGSIGSGVVIGRTPNLFALLSPQKQKKTGDAPKSSESKKSEGVGGKIKMGIDYNMFMRMCASAAYLDDNEDYWDALWEYYSEMGEIEDACEFFDNLFQYTSWCDEDEVYDEYLDDSYKDGTKSKAECIDAAVDAGDLDVFKTDKGYLVIQ